LALAHLTYIDRILDTHPESAAGTFIENAGKNIADIGMPGG
jgi:hypothetical protein